MTLRLLLGACLIAGAASLTAQGLRTLPVEKFAVNLGVRDLGPSTVAGTTVLVGGPTGKGGLFAVDATTGKMLWSFRPANTNAVGTSTPPVVSGNVVVTAFSTGEVGVLVGVSLATGKEIWRALSPAWKAAPVVQAGTAFVMGENGSFYAVRATTGKTKWTFDLSADRARCVSWPVVRDDTVYFAGAIPEDRSDPERRSGNFVFAVDADTGQERWRYQPEGIWSRNGACVPELVVTDDTVYAAAETRLFAVDRTTGKDRFAPVVVKQHPTSKEYIIKVQGLVDAGPVIVGMTKDYLFGFDKESGRNVWEVPVQAMSERRVSAVAGNVLYFTGSLSQTPTDVDRGKLHALDLETREVLWTFSRPTREANWSFGFVRPVDGGLWVDSYQALVKLE